MSQQANLRGSANCEQPKPTLSVGCYNLLCATYAVKWGEREGKGPDGESNWALRWPIMRDVINRASWDLVCMQEVEVADCEDVVAGLGPGYTCNYFKHSKRPPDGVMIALRKEAFDGSGVVGEIQFSGVSFGRVDATHKASGRKVRIVTAHLRGKWAEQLAALAAFADEANEADVTIITGDFNEDFGEGGRPVQCPFPEGPLGRYVTLARESDLPQVSRPPHKQLPDQKSGKGKIDYIFVRAQKPECLLELFLDEASRAAILESHKPCDATGQWPSDHGCEALSMRFL